MNYRYWRILVLFILVVVMSVVVFNQFNTLSMQIMPGLNVADRQLSLPAAAQPENDAQFVEAPTDLAAILHSLNAQRVANGLTEFRSDTALAEAARLVSEAAARQDTLDPAVDLEQTALSAGYRFATIQRMLISSAPQPPEQTAVSWWNSPNIQQALLTTEYSDIGLGRTPSVTGNYYYALLLANPHTLTAPGAQESNRGDVSQSGQARAVLALLNEARQAQSLRPLSLNSGLVSAAQRHSDDQAARDVMAHEGSDGSLVGDRVTAVGYAWSTVGENVLARPDIHAAGAFDQWWNSADHRAAMLNPDFSQVGIAYALSARGQYYYTMVLAAPR
jgi:uncharacterized protein YkwD